MNIREVSLSLADDLFVQSQTLAPWTVNYVDLEESLAVGSIAQEKLAHGGIMYALAGLSDTERDAHIYQRDSSSWSLSTLSFMSKVHWPDLIAGAYFCSQAALFTVEELMLTNSHAHEQLRLVRSEQILHVNHWRKWASMLFGNIETKSEMVTALEFAVSRCGDLIPQGSDHDAIFDLWSTAVSSDLLNWGIASPPIVERVARIHGGDRVVQLLGELSTARSENGRSNYAVY